MMGCKTTIIYDINEQVCEPVAIAVGEK